MFCDNGCLAISDDTKVYIIDKRTDKDIMHRTRDNKSTLYMVPLTTEKNEDMTECKIPERHFSGSLYEAKPKSDLSTFLHLACWSPCTSTMITAIKKMPLHMAMTHQRTCPKIPPKIRGNSKRTH